MLARHCLGNAIACRAAGIARVVNEAAFAVDQLLNQSLEFHHALLIMPEHNQNG